MSTAATIDAIRGIAAMEFGTPVEQITADSDLFEDHGLDDLDRLQLVCAVETAFRIRLDDPDFENVRTIRQLADVVAYVRERGA